MKNIEMQFNTKIRGSRTSLTFFKKYFYLISVKKQIFDELDQENVESMDLYGWKGGPRESALHKFLLSSNTTW